MRIEEFKMERQGQVEIGQKVTVAERSTIAFYYYIVNPAVAMSGNIPFNRRLKNKEGIVKNIRQDDRGYFLDVEFDED